MITTLEGTLVSATPLEAIIEIGGIGYEVHVPVTTAEQLPQAGKTVKLYTHVVYREDSQTLYGFSSQDERDFFRTLIGKVSGVGPKVALSIMSKLALPVLKSAILNGDVVLLAKSPGIGKKTAERLVIEMKDKITPGGMGSTIDTVVLPGDTSSTAPENRINDAVIALTTLGYKLPDADKAVRKAHIQLGAAATTEELIKRALG
jgi:Holliday junction DNA helicase RuvA